MRKKRIPRDVILYFDFDLKTIISTKRVTTREYRNFPLFSL